MKSEVNRRKDVFANDHGNNHHDNDKRILEELEIFKKKHGLTSDREAVLFMLHKLAEAC